MCIVEWVLVGLLTYRIFDETNIYFSPLQQQFIYQNKSCKLFFSMHRSWKCCLKFDVNRLHAAQILTELLQTMKNCIKKR